MASTGYALAPYIDSKEIPTTYPLMAPDDLTQRQRAKWIVRTGWNGQPAESPAWGVCLPDLKHRKVTVIALDYRLRMGIYGRFPEDL